MEGTGIKNYEYTERRRRRAIPLHDFDDTPLNRALLVRGLLRYKAVLEADKIRDALTCLVQRDSWVKMRGRLFINDRGRLEVHVPEEVTAEKQAIRFKRTAHKSPIADHPVVSQLAQIDGSKKCTIQPALAGRDDIQSVLVPAEWPRAFGDYVDPMRDVPVLGLHVVTFTDATILVLSFPHVLMDGGGIASLVRAWSQVLHGNGHAVPPLDGVDRDPLDYVRGQGSLSEPFVLADCRMDATELAPVGDDSEAMRDPDWVIHPLGQSCWRTMTFSAKSLSLLMRESADSVPLAADGTSAVFISEDDVLSAWAVRTLARMLPERRAINAMRFYDMRTRLPEFRTDKVYLQNLYQLAWSIFPSSGGVADEPLGKLASRLRADLAAQTTREQVTAGVIERGEGVVPLYGDPGGIFFRLNSWAKMALYEASDMTPAVVTSAVDGMWHEPVLPDLVDFDFGSGAGGVGPLFIWTGKNAVGIVTATVFLSESMWAQMEAAIAMIG